MKIAIITGASSGMGKWFSLYAKYFDKDIEEIWLIGRNKERLANVAIKIAEYSKVCCRTLEMDLTDEAEDCKLTDLLLQERPIIKLLVNNAGAGMIGSFSEIGLCDHSETILLNCHALTRITHYCLPFFCKGSHIINIASASAFMPQPDFAVYAATKSYVLRLSLALSKELKKRNIIVTAACPGAVRTNFFDHAEKYRKRKSYKNLFMYNERKVVIQVYQDAYRGKSLSIPGIMMKLLAFVSKLFPHQIIAK